MTITATHEVTTDRGFARLVRSHQDGLFSGALRMLGDRHAAEDAVQEAFVRAYRALIRMSDGDIDRIAMAPWLWTITANVCRNYWRTRSRHPEAPLETDVVASVAGPEDAAVGATERDRLSVLLLTLPWHRRAAVVLVHVVGLSYGEAAEAIGRPIGTVKSDVHRALSQLRTALKEAS